MNELAERVTHQVLPADALLGSLQSGLHEAQAVPNILSRAIEPSRKTKGFGNWRISSGFSGDFLADGVRGGE